MKRTNTVLATCFVLLFAATSLATDRTWDDGDMGDSHWSSAVNWSDNQVPVCGETAILSGTPTNWPTVTASDDFGGLTMSDSAQLTLGGNTLTVDGTFTVSDSANITISGSNGTIEADVVSFATNASISLSGVTITETDVTCD
jgi:hypothetical protein